MAEVLVVEDDPDHRQMVEHALRSSGWATRSAATLEEGWLSARERRPDVLVTDLDLPDGTGFELCARVKADPGLGSVPVVMMTGSFKAPADRERAVRAGADAFLLKPFPIPRLVRVVRELGGRR